jgi:hypothetical protein
VHLLVKRILNVIKMNGTTIKIKETVFFCPLLCHKAYFSVCICAANCPCQLCLHEGHFIKVCCLTSFYLLNCNEMHSFVTEVCDLLKVINNNRR